MGMGMGMGMRPPLSEPAEATGGMPSCSVPPQPSCPPQPQTPPEDDTNSAPAPQPEAAAAPAKEEGQEAAQNEQPRVVFNPEAAFMRGAFMRRPPAPNRIHNMFYGFPGVVPPQMVPMMLAGKPPAPGDVPMMGHMFPRPNKGGIIIEPVERKAKDECDERPPKKPAASSDDDEGVRRMNQPLSSSSSSSSDEEEKPSDDSSSQDEEEELKKEQDSVDDDELMLPPEVYHWCKYQLRKKYFRRMCKAYTVYYTRMTMLSEFYAYQYWHCMNNPSYGYMPMQMPMQMPMPMQPPMPMFMQQPNPYFYGPHHHHHHHPPPPQPFAPFAPFKEYPPEDRHNKPPKF